jgi:hypothetical protein
MLVISSLVEWLLAFKEAMLHVAVHYKCSELCIAPWQATCFVMDPHVMCTVGVVFVVSFLLHQWNWLRAHKGGYTLVTLPRTVTPHRDSVDGTRDHVIYQNWLRGNVTGMLGELLVFGRRINGMIRLRPEQVWTCNVTRHHSPTGTPQWVFNFLTFFEGTLYKSNCIIFILSWYGTHIKIRSKLVVIVMTGSQKITLWGPQGTPLGMLRVKRGNTVQLIPPVVRLRVHLSIKLH